MSKIKAHNRTYAAYEHLGRDLCDAHARVGAALVKASHMFRLDGPEVRALQKIDKAIQELRSDLDNHFCREVSEDEIPEGRPRFPLYPGPKTEQEKPFRLFGEN